MSSGFEHEPKCIPVSARSPFIIIPFRTERHSDVRRPMRRVEHVYYEISIHDFMRNLGKR